MHSAKGNPPIILSQIFEPITVRARMTFAVMKTAAPAMR